MLPSTRLIVSFLLLSIFFLDLPASAVTLSEAIKNKWVSATISGINYREDSVYRSAFYGHCMKISCRNLTTRQLAINEIPGRLLIPGDTSTQRMVITAPFSFTLAPGKEISVNAFAMCTQSDNGAPNEVDRFTAGAVASKDLLTVVNFISVHQVQNDMGQQAIWCITDHHSPYAIFSVDTALMEQLRKMVCELTGIPYVKGKNGSEPTPRFRLVDGSFEYTIERAKTVDLFIYNEAGQLVKNCVDHEIQQAGTHKYTYHFRLPINDDALLKQSLLIRFYLNGELITEKKHILSSR